MSQMNAPSTGFVENLPVLITGLGGVETVVNGTALGMSSNTMSLRASSPIEPGRPLKIEAEDTLWLGEVLQCQEEDGEYRVTVGLAHALYGLSDLARLAERFGVTGKTVEATKSMARSRRAAEPTTVAGD